MKANTISSIMGRLVIQENGCALWPGMLSHNGYGHVAYQGRKRYVHRLLYEHFIGPVPDDMELDHVVCHRRNCANFYHLEPTTHTENVRRGASSAAYYGQRTHCENGHEFTPDNIYWRTDGPGRKCRACEQQRSSIRAQRRTAERRIGVFSPPKPRVVVEKADQRKRNTIIDIMGRLVIQENGCALWPGSKTENGYGQVSFQGRMCRVHRLLYQHLIGPVPPDRLLDHFYCQTRACGNPYHLEPVTHQENTLRGNTIQAVYARRTACSKGHPFSPENTARRKDGSRRCRQCARTKALQRYYVSKEKRAGLL